MAYILLIVGFVLLVKGADIFVDGSVGIAEKFKIPSFIIGLTIVAMGTSAPEAAVSITAALAGQNDIATGNVIGSNIFNTIVVLGVCSAIRPIRVDGAMMKKEFPLNFVVAVLMLVLAVTNIGSAGGYAFSRIDGMIFLVGFVGYLLMTILPELNNDAKHEEEEHKVISIPMAILKIGIGLVGIILGGRVVVDAASDIAAAFGVSENLIGLTIVAVGTSLPELVTSIVAAGKGESDMAVGNVIGSNLFNILFVLGISSAIHPINVNPLSIFDLWILLGITALTTLFCGTKLRLSRVEGVILTAIYIAYTVYLIMRSTGTMVAMTGVIAM